MPRRIAISPVRALPSVAWMVKSKRGGMAAAVAARGRRCRPCIARRVRAFPYAMTIDKDALREMARHRGLKLKTSRRRKPGGDFGKYGLTDAAGEAVLGIGENGLTASAEEIEAYLRDAARATWKTSAGSAKIKKAPPPPKPPRPKPPPKLKVANPVRQLPAAKRAEAFTAIAEKRGTRIERIVSRRASDTRRRADAQDHDEWVIVLRGEAGLRIEDSAEAVLRPGDPYPDPSAAQRHWVTYTAKDEPTVWLAVHFG